MGHALVSGPAAVQERRFSSIRTILTAAKDNMVLKEPVRKSARLALTWIREKDLSLDKAHDGDREVLSAVRNLRSVLSSIAGGQEDAQQTQLAHETRRASQRIGRQYGLIPRSSDTAPAAVLDASAQPARPQQSA